MREMRQWLHVDWIVIISGEHKPLSVIDESRFEWHRHHNSVELPILK